MRGTHCLSEDLMEYHQPRLLQVPPQEQTGAAASGHQGEIILDRVLQAPEAQKCLLDAAFRIWDLDSWHLTPSGYN